LGDAWALDASRDLDGLGCFGCGTRGIIRCSMSYP
jgi:hypothetical protein